MHFKIKVEDKLSLIFRVNKFVEETAKIRKSKKLQPLIPLLVGDSGVGKSTRVLELLGEEEVRIVILSLLLPEDVGGYPRPDDEEMIMKFYLPDWVKYKYIFFDEIDKATKNKISTVLSAITERKVHGYSLKDKVFVFGAQPSILAYLDDPQNDTYWAFSQRCVIIPVLSEEAYEYVNREHGWDLKIMAIRDKEIVEFRMKNPPSPRVLNYIGYFMEYLLFSDDPILGEVKNIEEKVNRVIEIVSEMFYYYPLPFEAMVKQNVSRYEKVSYEEKLVAITEKIKAGPVEAMMVLPQAAIMFEAVPFFAAFTAVFERISQDEKQKVMEGIYNEVAAAGEFTKSEVVDVARAFLISVAYLLEDQKDKEELFKRIKSSFPKTLKEFEKVYNEIVAAWDNQ
jgi:hypothetical protein